MDLFKDSRIEKNKVRKNSETMYRVITVFSVSETPLSTYFNKTENPLSHQDNNTVDIRVIQNFKHEKFIWDPADSYSLRKKNAEKCQNYQKWTTFKGVY